MVCVCVVTKQYNTNSTYIPTHIAYCNVVMFTKIYDTYKNRLHILYKMRTLYNKYLV